MFHSFPVFPADTRKNRFKAITSYLVFFNPQKYLVESLVIHGILEEVSVLQIHKDLLYTVAFEEMLVSHNVRKWKFLLLFFVTKSGRS